MLTFALMVLLLLGSSVSGAAAQEWVVAESVCAGCLRADRVLTVGSLDGPDAIESHLALALRDGRGRYYVVERYGTRIKVFGRNGRFLRILGREGSGPGEFKGIGTLASGPDDALIVFDNANVRYSVFDSAGIHQRDVILDLPPLIEAVHFDDFRLALVSPVRTPDLAGLPLHLFDRHGKRVRSFGSRDGFLRSDVPFVDDRAIAAGRDGIWSAFRNQYVIELWDTAGEHVVTLRREAEWFPSWLTIRGSPQDLLKDPPKPYLTDIRETDGHLWVAIQIPDPRWREAVRRNQGYHTAEVTDRTRYLDTRIEVIDLASRQVIATMDLDQPLGGFADDMALFGTRLDPTGIPHVDVWQLTLNRNGASR